MQPVVLFPTCLVEHISPAVGAATARALTARGCHVALVRGATCCGQPAWNAGYAPEARRVAVRTLRALTRTEGPVVVPSGSCATMIRTQWPKLLAGTPEEPLALRVAARVRELSELVAELGAEDRAAGGRPVSYHDSCHMLRELGITDQPRRLLAGAGYRVVEMPGAERCCGFGGTFSVKLPEVSVAMADEKLDEAVTSGCDEVVSCDLSCLLHLEGRARRRGLTLRFRHLAEVLDER